MSNALFSQVYDIRDFGAIGNGVVDDTQAVRSAIERCAADGGGRVLVPPGLYVTGPITLRSQLDLHLARGATLKASPKISDYFETRTSFESPRVGLIFARDVTDVTISGEGTIDCSGPAFMDMRARHLGSTIDFDRLATRQGARYMEPLEGREDGPVVPLDRPGNSIQFLGCSGIELRGIRIVDSPNWTVNFVQCRDVSVRNVRIHNNQLVPNSDGIHITGCENVRITDCDIQTGDDAIAITSLPTGGVPRPGPTRGVLVCDCRLASRSAGVRVGYGTDDIEDCLFSNLTIDSNRGIGVFIRYAGSVRNISFRRLLLRTRLHTGHWWGHGEAIHISALPGPEATDLGYIDQVSFSQVVARSESGIVVFGRPTGHIRDLLFDDVQVALEHGSLSESYGGNLDLRPSADLALAIHEHAEYGVFVRGADHAMLRDVGVRLPEPPGIDLTGPLCVVDSPDFRCVGFQART